MLMFYCGSCRSDAVETKQDLNVAQTVILDGEYSECESSVSFIAENLYFIVEICAFLRGRVLRRSEW